MQMKRKPKFGQNFLVDDAARHAIVDALAILASARSLRSTGHGAITEVLAGRCHCLIALELDHSLAAELTFRFRPAPGEIVRRRSQDRPSNACAGGRTRT
jgi:16S rRNA (adenine1518-N6/adenine1519-N6)-dimethyltransferase